MKKVDYLLKTKDPEIENIKEEKKKLSEYQQLE